jgi:Fe-S-cluster containining protein
MVRVLQELGGGIVAAAEEASRRRGEPISCREGCGACCRQMVPVSPDEAVRLADLVRAMPWRRRDRVRARFREAAARLRAAGALPPSWSPGAAPKPEERRPFSERYFAAAVPCPFLEEERCTIHPDRPMACREYSVTTPASLCARPTEESVRTVEVPARLARLLFRWDGRRFAEEARWLPLVLSLEHAAAADPSPAPLPAPEVLEAFLGALEAEIDEALARAPDPREGPLEV